MLLILCLCLLGVFDVQASGQEFESQNVDEEQMENETKTFWKAIFNTYYALKGSRNASTDKLVESFFEHDFEAYPRELYPAFKKIFVHISKSNDRIWNFYESILHLYHNVEAADRIYETVVNRFALGKLMGESGELDASFPLDASSESATSNLQQRSGVLFEEDEVIPDFEQPCEDCGVPTLQVGSIRAIPGEHFPNYEEIPITPFTCAGKHIPGFYADLDTGCQVFHVCYPHRRESFLCPIGTTFNQAILACDYWYSSNCSLAPLYYISGPLALDEFFTEGKETFVDHLLEQHGTLETVSTATHGHIDHPVGKPEDKSYKPKSPKVQITLPNIDWTLMIKFLPIKSKIIECPDICESTTAYPTSSTTIAEPIVDESTTRSTVPPKKEYTSTTTRPVVKPREPSTTSRPVVTPVLPGKDKYPTKRPVVTPAPPMKDKHFEKTEKSEILLDILKAVKLLTKDAEGFLTKILQKKHEQKVVPVKKPTVAPLPVVEKPKPFPEINQRFVVKPAKGGLHPKRPTVTRSKLIKPSKQISKSKQHDAIRKETSKFVLQGMKALSSMFD